MRGWVACWTVACVATLVGCSPNAGGASSEDASGPADSGARETSADSAGAVDGGLGDGGAASDGTTADAAASEGGPDAGQDGAAVGASWPATCAPLVCPAGQRSASTGAGPSTGRTGAPTRCPGASFRS
jgi:hypothetical protein